MTFFLKIYDWLSLHRKVFWWGMLAVVTLCLFAATRLTFKEDISDFLPLTESQAQAMDIYQRISGAEKIVVIFEGGDTDRKLDAVDFFRLKCELQDSLMSQHLVTQIDVQQYLDVLHWVYLHIPYFLAESDYLRIDSVLQSPDAVTSALQRITGILQMPVSSFMISAISDDPLSLFAPVVSSLQDFRPATQGFTSLDGYMVSADEGMAFAIFNTPFGASETRRNAQVTAWLSHVSEMVMQEFPDVSVRLMGAPVVAVGNASRIKKDSFIAVLLAVVGILVILLYCFRHDLRSILLILLTIAFGWLFAMAVVALTRHEISLIVLGIGSVIIGIAVNYPLHILFHRRYTASVRQTLQEVVAPLVIGNITTVGAFLALVPLQAVAMRDLGVFAASMLVGTILFSIIALPLMMKNGGAVADDNIVAGEARRPWRPATRYGILAFIALVTAGLYWVGRDITFDADVSHINYMTPQQRADFAHFASLAGESGTESVYVAEMQEVAVNPDIYITDTAVAAVRSPWRWLPDAGEQAVRLQRWNDFWADRKEPLLRQLRVSAERCGFREDAFRSFADMLSADYQVLEFDDFLPLAENMLTGYWLKDSANVVLVTRLQVCSSDPGQVEERIKSILPAEAQVFDIRSLNKTIAGRLADNFDYIGWVCSLLVFFFLWISMRSWRAALVAFLPMAVSWVWILGIMHMLGLQFNIVNIILATFIFGQGDDYTVFVVEGLQYEHRTGRRMLPKFRNSIILSALIMFVGIGVLVIARHPAMHSLGAVTLIGMSVVVLVANIVPPLMREVLFGLDNNNRKNI